MKGFYKFALVSVLSLTSCQLDVGISDSVKKSCARICRSLKTCKMLPSALGSGSDQDQAKANCRTRCELTSKSMRNDIENCLEEVDAGANWCNERSPCIDAQDCLLGLFSSDVNVIGTGEVSVRFALGSEDREVDGGCQNLYSTDWYCEGSPGGWYGQSEKDRHELYSKCMINIKENKGNEEKDHNYYCGEDKQVCEEALCGIEGSEKLCEALNIADIRVFALQKGIEYQEVSRSCADALTGRYRFPDLLPGKVKVGAKIRGAIDRDNIFLNDETPNYSCVKSDTDIDASTAPDSGVCANADKEDLEQSVYTDSQSWCFVVFGRELLVGEGKTVPSTIPVLPANKLGQIIEGIYNCPNATGRNYLLCEETLELCHDNRDNDGDTKIDCLDEDCAGLCQENTAALCNDNIDNDLDGLSDWDDPECQEQRPSERSSIDAGLNKTNKGTQSLEETDRDPTDETDGPAEKQDGGLVPSS